MSDSFIKTGVWLVATVCALTGFASIFYGYIAIYSLSGFTSIFIGVAIILIAIGLIKRHSVARVGAIVVLMICSTGCLMWLFFYQYNPNAKLDNLGLIEYFCLIYILLAMTAICFLLIKSTKEYFSLNNEGR